MGVEEPVVDDFDAGIVGGEKSNLVGDGLSLGKSGNILADVREAQDKVLGIRTAQLRLGFLPKDNKVGIGVVCKNSTSGFAKTRVDTTTEALIRAGDNEQRLFAFQRLGFGILEHCVGSLTIGS